jgi:hypothetical protein
MEKTKCIHIESINDVLADETEEIFNGIFPVGISTLAGYPGAGKTYSSIYIAILYAMQNPAQKTMLWLSEDSKQQIKKRIIYLKNRYGFNTENIDFVFDVPLPLMINKSGGYVKSEYYDEIKSVLQGYPLVFLDPLVDFFVGDNENGNEQIAKFLLAFKKIAKEKEISIVFLHHVNKERINSLKYPNLEYITSEEKELRLLKVRGASAVAGSSRMILYCETNELKTDERILSIVKNNSGPDGQIVYRVQLPPIQQKES